MAFAYYDWIAHHAEARGERTAMIDLATRRATTYAEMHERVDRLASHLRSLGVVRGDRVGVLALNSTATLEVQFAAFRLGAIFVPLNFRLTAHELAYIVGDADPRVLLHDPEFSALIEELKTHGVAPKTIIYGAPYEAAIAAAARLEAYEAVDLSEVSTLMYTSGTTGLPKGAMITHLMTFINAVNMGVPIGISPETVFLCVLPLFHTAALNCYCNPVLHGGGTVVLARSFDPGEALAAIDDPGLGVDGFVGVPAVLLFMSQHPAFETTDFSRLEYVGVGGAPSSLALLEAWRSRGCALMQIYGMTETGPGVFQLDRCDAVRKAGSCGKRFLHTETRIVGADGLDVAPGERGELWVKGPNITPGYWRKPEATQASFTQGWFHTGDMAMIDEEGFHYIVDRSKDMYISGGENVYPAEVENVLFQLEAIADVAVIGIPDERWGETGLAVVVLKSGFVLGEEDLIAHCRERLGRYKVPGGVVFTDVLPRTGTGKVHKPTLRKAYIVEAEA
jgi:fatty-acyl-CoA synthase